MLYSPTKEGFKGKRVQIPITVEFQTEESILDNGLRLAKGSVNGKSVSMLRDTGATTIFVSDSVVNRDHMTMNKKEVTLANGDVQLCPEVRIHIESPYITGTIDALVLNNPFADVVVGNLGNVYPTSETRESVQVTTRRMAKQEELDKLIEITNYQKWKADDYKDEDGDLNRKVSSDYISEVSSRDELIDFQVR